MANPLNTLIHRLAIPAITLTVMLVTAIFASQLSVFVYWPITVAMFGLLLAWQRSLRRTWSATQTADVNLDRVAIVRPYAITYAILYAVLVVGALCGAYFGVGLPYLVPWLASWYIRRVVWLAFLMRGGDVSLGSTL